MLQIDLQTPHIPNSRRVWRMFPGQSYRFLPNFLNNQEGYLDLPGFTLPEGPLKDDEFILTRLVASQATKQKLIESPQNDPLVLDLNSFPSPKKTQTRGRYRQAIISLYEEAKVGDLVVLPSPIYSSEIHIGEFTSSEIHYTFFRRYGETTIPARSIRWLEAVPENTVSIPLSQSLRTQHPFTLLERSLKNEVFALTYGSFISGTTHVSTIENQLDDYLDSDSALIASVTRLCAAACEAIDNDLDGLGGRGLVDVLIREPPIDYTCSQSIHIHSKGFNRFTSNTVLPISISATLCAIILLSGCDSKEAAQDHMSQISVINTSANHDPACSAKVHDITNRVLTELGIDKTWTLCEAAKAARARSGLSTSAKGTIVHRR